MAEESIIQYKKPGFPKPFISEKDYGNLIEYIGPQVDLEGANATLAQSWGGYDGVITQADLNPIEGTALAELTVRVTRKTDLASDSTVGEKERETYEIEWVKVSRPLKEHPAFYNLLSVHDLVDIEYWRNEPDPTLKVAYKYDARINIDGVSDETELEPLAKKYAKAILLGFEEYEDYAPVVRKTSFYVNGPPPDSDAGQKQDPIGVPNLPAGWEFRKSADRSINANGQTRWEKIEEWEGAKKVLIDRDEIFFTA